ncbi:MAG TPA: hypothetical protein PKY59_25695 [Pyrinomonadaceae bacterium]|nr:hypothetical protein [Pyrinomonadaceae bacterium]
MIYRALTVFFLLFFFSLPNAFGQTKAELKEQERERKKAEDIQRTNKFISDNIASIRDSREIFNLDFFLPDYRNSWTVSISSTDKNSGKKHLLAAVNSNGNYLCHPRTFDVTRNLVESNIFGEINRLVNREKFLLNATVYYDEAETSEAVNQSSAEIMTIARKTKNDIIKDNYNVKILESAAPNLWEIYEKVLNSAACQ